MRDEVPQLRARPLEWLTLSFAKAWVIRRINNMRGRTIARLKPMNVNRSVNITHS